MAEGGGGGPEQGREAGVQRRGRAQVQRPLAGVEVAAGAHERPRGGQGGVRVHLRGYCDHDAGLQVNFRVFITKNSFFFFLG